MSAFLVITVIILLFSILFYNTLIGKRNQMKNAFSCVDVFLKKRYDLIPNLVSITKGYIEYEKSVLVEITELRQKGISEILSKDQKIARYI
jgi:LemA protein